MMAQYASILFSMILVNNFVLVRFLGICPFLGVSKKFDSAVGMGVGFTISLVLMSAVRELLGAGTLAGIQIMPSFIEPMIIMVTPPGGFAVLGVLIAGSVWLEQRRARKEGRPVEAAPESPCDGCALACGLNDPASPDCARDAADVLVAKVEAALEEEPRIVRVEVQGEEADA